MTIRSTLLGIGVILWLAALGCWLRARGNGRVSREGWLFLLLGAPFFVAGFFFTSSSYPHERPLPISTPAPMVILTTPPPAELPAAKPSAHSYAEAVNAAQYAAVARYPALGKTGTDFNRRFIAEYHRLRIENPNFFVDPDWPLRLADEVAGNPEPPP